MKCKKCGKEMVMFKNGLYCPCSPPPLMIFYCYNLKECLENLKETGHNIDNQIVEYLTSVNKYNSDSYECLQKDSHPAITELFNLLGIEENEFLFEID